MSEIIIRKYRNNILLFLAVLFFIIFLNYVSVRLYNLYYINANTNFNKNSITFSLTVPDQDGASKTISKEQLITGDSRIAVYSRLQNSGMNVYKVLYSALKFEVTEGTYFNDGDLSDSGGFYAVIGSLADEITDTSDIVISGHHYTVKGVFNDKNKPSNNYTIYINDNSENIPLNTQMILDGRNKSEIRKAFAEISDNASANGLDIKVYENEDISLEYFIHYQKPLIVIFGFIIVVVLFLNFVLSVFWLYSNQRMIAVLNMIGKRYYRSLFKTYAKLTLASNAAGLVISLNSFMNSDHLIIAVLVFALMELIELTAIGIGFFYFSLKNTKELLEIDYE